MRKFFEELEENVDNKNINLIYEKWMRVVLRRAREIGEYEIPIAAIIIDQKGRCIGRGSNKREINKDPLGHAELIALRQAAWIRNDWRFNDCFMVYK